MKSIIILLLITSCIVSAEDIILKNGKVYKNVRIVDDKSSNIICEFNGKRINIGAKNVLRIDYNKKYNPNENSILGTGEEITEETSKEIVDDPCNDKVLLQLQKKDSLTFEEMKIYAELKRQCRESQRLPKQHQSFTPIKHTVTEYPNLWMLPFGIISGGVSYHFFKKASDEGDAISLLSAVNLKSDELENDRMTHTYLGAGFAILGLGLTFASLQSVEVEVTQTGYAINYKFYLK